jgi:hypothetical protein
LAFFRRETIGEESGVGRKELLLRGDNELSLDDASIPGICKTGRAIVFLRSSSTGFGVGRSVRLSARLAGLGDLTRTLKKSDTIILVSINTKVTPSQNITQLYTLFGKGFGGSLQ